MCRYPSTFSCSVSCLRRLPSYSGPSKPEIQLPVSRPSLKIPARTFPKRCISSTCDNAAGSKSASSGLSTPREDAATTNTLKVRSLPPGAWPFLEMPGPHFGIHCTNAGFARAALVLSAKPCDENQQAARGSGIPTCGVRKPARLPSDIRTSNLEIGPDMYQIRPWTSSLFLPNPFTQD